MENDKLENIDGKLYLNGLEMLSAGAAHFEPNCINIKTHPSREMIAAMCLQGILANPNVYINNFGFDVGKLASNAVYLADELLAELERTKE